MQSEPYPIRRLHDYLGRNSLDSELAGLGVGARQRRGHARVSSWKEVSKHECIWFKSIQLSPLDYELFYVSRIHGDKKNDETTASKLVLYRVKSNFIALTISHDIGHGLFCIIKLQRRVVGSPPSLKTCVGLRSSENSFCTESSFLTELPT